MPQIAKHQIPYVALAALMLAREQELGSPPRISGVSHNEFQKFAHMLKGPIRRDKADSMLRLTAYTLKSFMRESGLVLVTEEKTYANTPGEINLVVDDSEKTIEFLASLVSHIAPTTDSHSAAWHAARSNIVSLVNAAHEGTLEIFSDPLAEEAIRDRKKGGPEAYINNTGRNQGRRY